MPKLIDKHKAQDEICTRLAQGQSLRKICEDKHMPHTDTVMDWLRHDPAFSVQYAHAREAQAELMADKMVELALEPPKNADPQLLRVQMDAIKWAAGKIRPVKYGEANLLKRRADLEFEKEMINITPEASEDENLPQLDRKQLARVIWHIVNSKQKSEPTS